MGRVLPQYLSEWTTEKVRKGKLIIILVIWLMYIMKITTGVSARIKTGAVSCNICLLQFTVSRVDLTGALMEICLHASNISCGGTR